MPRIGPNWSPARMSSASIKIALFIDGPNLYSTAKSLGFDIDYNITYLSKLRPRHASPRLLLHGHHRGSRISSIRPLVDDWLDYNGYTVVTKANQKNSSGAASRRGKVKGNMDIELAVNAMELAGQIDEMILFSGRRRFPLAGRGGAAPRRPRHGGFCRPCAKPPMIADELRRQADYLHRPDGAARPRVGRARPSARRRPRW